MRHTLLLLQIHILIATLQNLYLYIKPIAISGRKGTNTNSQMQFNYSFLEKYG